LPESASTDEDGGSGVDLLENDFEDLIRTSESRNLRWICRLIILCALLAQTLAAVIVWSRRTFPSLAGDVKLFELMGTYWEAKHKSAAFDVFNGAYAIGGMITIMNTLALSICNWKWQYTPSSSLSDRSDRRSFEYGADSHQNFGRELQLATILFILVTAEFWKRYLDMHLYGRSSVPHRILFAAFISFLFISSFWDVRTYLLRRNARHWAFWLLADYSKLLAVAGIFLISTVWVGLDFADYAKCHDADLDCLKVLISNNRTCQPKGTAGSCENPLVA